MSDGVGLFDCGWHVGKSSGYATLTPPTDCAVGVRGAEGLIRNLMRILLCILLCLYLSVSFAQAPVDLVRVIKSERKLMLFSEGKVIHEFRVALGGNPKGHKQQEGDKRTPEGRYTLDYKKADSAFYKAIHISYPSPDDVASAKKRGVSPGGQIMIHGQKGLGWLGFLSRHRDWTEGCISLKNDEMDVVWNLVKEGTQVEILP